MDEIQDLPRALEQLILQPAPKVIPLRIPSASRNNTLTSLAGLLRRQGLEEGGIGEALEALNKTLCYPPLESQEVMTIAKSIC